MESKEKPWRTNVGLRLSKENGEWFEKICKEEVRPYANFVEWLIIQEKTRRGKKTPQD